MNQEEMLERVKDYCQVGDHSAAEELLDKLIQVDDANIECQVLKVKLLAQRGSLNEALTKLEAILRGNPENIDALEIGGIIHAELGDLEAAESVALQLSLLNKESPQALRLCAHVLRRLGQYEQAFAAAKQAVMADKESGLAHYLSGVIALELREYAPAAEHLARSLELQPNRLATEMNLALALDHLGKYEESFNILTNSIERRGGIPTESDSIMLARHWLERGDLSNAQKAVDRVLAENSTCAFAINILGLIQQLKGELDQAISSFLLATLYAPKEAVMHSNLGLAYLLLGNYQNGWLEYEWRRVDYNIEPEGLASYSELKGPSSLPNTILITCEQGLGDVIHFARYAQFFKDKGCDVKLFASDKLTDLLTLTGLFKQTSNKISDLVANETDLEWIPIMSIPRVLGVTRENPIYDSPYLSIPQDLIEKWGEIMGASEKFRVGIHWQGNPETEKTTLSGRSMPLQMFANIISSTPDAEWISLQKGYGQEQMNTFSQRNRLPDYQNIIDSTWNFVETGAIVLNCNLIITTDSAIAHLAGSIGHPVWLLLAAVPDWRWGLESDKSPWYPSMRLFRQRRFGDWPELMERVQKELADAIMNNNRPPNAR